MVKKIEQRLVTITDALKTLHRGIELFEEQKQSVTTKATEKDKELLISLRDSMIQRFEYCTDLLWKTLKLYLEEIEKTIPSSSSPRGIIREAAKVKIITEQEGADCIVMVDNRNQTSHIYHQELAEEIADHIPQFYALMNTIVSRLHEKTGV
jgi:nucleotidyltransferase substrate binding protein (TIGR01987 family)